jgi:hypothetical protein
MQLIGLDQKLQHDIFVNYTLLIYNLYILVNMH